MNKSPTKAIRSIKWYDTSPKNICVSLMLLLEKKKGVLSKATIKILDIWTLRLG